MSQSNIQHRYVLDLARALAALVVCLDHSRHLVLADLEASSGLAEKAVYFATNAIFGHQAVIVFFLLSGYLVGGSAIRTIDRGTWRWRNYLLDRFTRLWIVLIPALFLTAAFDGSGLTFGGPVVHLPGAFYYEHHTAALLRPSVFVCNAAFLQTLVCDTYGTNLPLWSLASEFWFYLWFPALYAAWKAPKSARATRYVVALAAIVTMGLFSSLLKGFLLWMVGCAIAWIEPRLNVRTRDRRRVVYTPIAFLIVTLANVRAFLLDDWATGSAFACLLLCIVFERACLPFDWMSRAAALFSAFSYSLYLTHYPFVILICSLLFKQRLAWNHEGVLLWIATVAACYLLAWIHYLVFESHTTRVREVLKEFYARITGGNRLAELRVGVEE
jgi:peptidoglycan/LPS O-acetylase OafA/YrhL